jgi:probable phosphoglycerate mutase
VRLYLARHGQTSWNIAGRAQGHTDISLDETGQAQALALGRSLSGITRVITSDLARARQTGEVFGLPVETRPEIRERSFGEWEGRDYLTVMSDLEALAVEQGVDRMHVRPPGGESFLDVWNRVGPVVEELKAFDENTLVVVHGGAKAVILARLLEGKLETIRGFRFPNCAVTTFERRPEGSLVMVRYAECFT